MMEMQPVKSSNVEAVGYDEGTSTLTIKFKSGGIYQYPGVDPDTHLSLMGAESIGRFVNQNIVKAGFKGQRVDPENQE